MSFHLRYALNCISLWLTKKISWATFLYGIKERIVALAGPEGAYVVDPDFE